MRIVNANDIKKRGLSAICDDEETIVTIRGKPRYVVLTIKKYQALSEAELSLAVAEAKADYKAGRYVVESPEAHLKRITNSNSR